MVTCLQASPRAVHWHRHQRLQLVMAARALNKHQASPLLCKLPLRLRHSQKQEDAGRSVSEALLCTSAEDIAVWADGWIRGRRERGGALYSIVHYTMGWDGIWCIV